MAPVGASAENTPCIEAVSPWGVGPSSFDVMAATFGFDGVIKPFGHQLKTDGASIFVAVWV